MDQADAGTAVQGDVPAEEEGVEKEAMKFYLYYLRHIPSATWSFVRYAPFSHYPRFFSSVHLMCWNVAILDTDISEAKSQMELDAVIWRARKWTREQEERIKKL